MSEMSTIDPPCDAQRHGEVAAAQQLTEGQGARRPFTTTLPASRSPAPSLRDGEERQPATHFSRDKQVRFLETLALWGNARAACKAVPVAPQTVYRYRRNTPDFALAWDAAMVAARPHAEDVLGDRALNGVEEVIYYHGEEIGRRRRYDSRLLLAHLARLDGAACDERIEAVAGDFDAALERLRRGLPVDPEAEPDPCDDAEPWMDESLPFAERVLLYLDSLEDDETEGEGAKDDCGDDDADLPDPFAWTDEDEAQEDDYEYEAEEDFDASRYILPKPSQDSVTPVTPVADQAPARVPTDPSPAPHAHRAATDAPQAAADGAGQHEAPSRPAFRIVRPWDTTDTPRLFRTFGPPDDGRCTPFHGRPVDR